MKLSKCLHGQMSSPFWANFIWANVQMSKIKLGKIFWANVDGQIESAQRSLNRGTGTAAASILIWAYRNWHTEVSGMDEDDMTWTAPWASEAPRASPSEGAAIQQVKYAVMCFFDHSGEWLARIFELPRHRFWLSLAIFLLSYPAELPQYKLVWSFFSSSFWSFLS